MDSSLQEGPDPCADAMVQLEARLGVSHVEPGFPDASGWPQSAARRARPRLEALASAYLRFSDEERDLYLAARQGASGEAFLAAGAAYLFPVVQAVLAESGGPEGTIKGMDANEATMALWALLDGSILAAIKEGPDFRGADHGVAAARALEVMLEGLS